MRYLTKEIQPRDAQKLLDGRANNRPLSQAQVDRLARDMRVGAWRLTGVPIILNDKGQLIDGQHRLAAVVAADVPVTMTICYGVTDPDAPKSIDTGRIRTNVHVLTMFFGMKSAARAAGLAKMLCMLERDSALNIILSADDVAKTIETRPGARWVMDTAEASTSSRKSSGPILAAFAIAYERDPVQTMAAFRAFHDNAYQGTGDPMNTLSKWLDANPRAFAHGRADRLALSRRTLSALAARFQGQALHKCPDSAEGMKYFGVNPDPKARRK